VVPDGVEPGVVLDVEVPDVDDPELVNRIF
jgi:hypothetical protein